MSTDRTPAAGEIWAGPGGRFEVVTPAEHFVTRDALVVYRAEDGSSPCYVCTLEAFQEFWKPTGEVKKTQAPEAGEPPAAPADEAVRPAAPERELSPEAKEFRDQVFGAKPETDFSEEDFLQKFFAADDSSVRIEIINENWRHITDRIIDNIGIVMDMPIRKGTIDERLVELTGCLRTRARFEGKRDRLRGDY